MRRLALALLAFCVAPLAVAAPERTKPGQARLIAIEGGIGVATSEFVAREVKNAEDAGAAVLILALDTPGGLVVSTRDIIKTLLAARVPIVVYVAPAGAQAASAGTYIVYASHIAAMAPATNMGAATPISLGGVPGLPEPEPGKDERKDGDDKSQERKAPASMEHKIVNDAAAFIRSLAQLRGRNADWAEKAVREAATITAEEAVKEGVIDVLAASAADLLAKIDGRKVVLPQGERVLALRDAMLVEIAPDWRIRALGVITDPNVAYILLLMGIYGVLFEFWNPGFVLPGVVGGISLLVALTALAMLPVDYAGLALILLGIGLMTAEAFVPGVGILGIGGLIAFVVGSIFLFEPSGVDFEFGLAWPVIAAAALATAAFFLGALGLAVRARGRRVVAGREEMIGLEAEVLEWDQGRGRVRAHGEVWQARSDAHLDPGQRVRVRRLEGLTLLVEPLTAEGKR
jgi:membrane-bound serine protease (ClpP class)